MTVKQLWKVEGTVTLPPSGGVAHSKKMFVAVDYAEAVELAHEVLAQGWGKTTGAAVHHLTLVEREVHVRVGQIVQGDLI